MRARPFCFMSPQSLVLVNIFLMRFLGLGSWVLIAFPFVVGQLGEYGAVALVPCVSSCVHVHCLLLSALAGPCRVGLAGQAIVLKFIQSITLCFIPQIFFSFRILKKVIYQALNCSTVLKTHNRCSHSGTKCGRVQLGRRKASRRPQPLFRCLQFGILKIDIFAFIFSDIMRSELSGPYENSWASFNNGGLKPLTLMLEKGHMGLIS